MMMLSRISSLATAAIVSAALSAQCQLDPNVGTNLSLSDDSVSPPQALGFNFTFAGQTYDSVVVSSNGFVYLFQTGGTPPTNSRCCNGAAAAMLANPEPMICGLWQDLNPSAGGTVNFNALTGKALITWLTVPEFGSAGSANSFQIVLNSNGTIDMVFDQNCANNTHTALTGWSPGAGATDPGASDFGALPINAGSTTVYEVFANTTFDLAGGYQAIPQGSTGWLVVGAQGCATSSVVGRGCPKPCTFYELFAGSAIDLSNSSILFTALGNGAYSVSNCGNCFDNGFTNALTLGDDQLAVGQALGFTFNWCGGSTTAIDVCSNGFVWLNSGSTVSADFSPTAAEFVANPARIAAAWMDLNPAAGGTVYFDALPNKALVTWNNVAMFGVAGSSNTMQLQLFPNGNMILAYGTVLNNRAGIPEAIVGFTPGAVADPGSIDLTASIPFVTGNAVAPATLAAQAGSAPVLGTTFVMEAGNVRPTTVGGNLVIGVTNPNLDLSFLSLTGCTLLASLDVVLPIATTSPTTVINIPIPNQAALRGRSVQSQVILIDPTIGFSIPAYLTNGVTITMGN